MKWIYAHFLNDDCFSLLSFWGELLIIINVVVINHTNVEPNGPKHSFVVRMCTLFKMSTDVEFLNCCGIKSVSVVECGEAFVDWWVFVRWEMENGKRENGRGNFWNSLKAFQIDVILGIPWVRDFGVDSGSGKRIWTHFNEPPDFNEGII